MKEVVHFNDDNEIDEIMKHEDSNRGQLICAAISDLHFPVSNIGPENQYKILKEQFIDKIALIPRLDVVYILGDLYDHKVLTTSDAAMYASMFIGQLVELCKKKNATLLIIQGTLYHDSNQLSLYYHYIYEEGIDIRIVTRVQFEWVKGCKILCIPELYGYNEEYYRNFLFDSGFYDMAVMHGTFKGAVYGDNAGNGRLFTIDDFCNCRGPILGGHVHKPDVYDGHFYYCGSPYAWTFADDHDKSFILLAYDMDTRKYYIDRVQIHSYIYQTISIDNLTSTDPQLMIAYIDKFKKENNIDYIRVQFNTEVTKIFKMILNNNYRNNDNVTLVFPTTEEEQFIKKQESEIDDGLKKWNFLLDPKISDMEKFVMYVNMIHSEDYITVDELKEILEDCDNEKR